MSVPMSPESRQRWIAKALDRVKLAAKVRDIYAHVADDSRSKTPENDEMTREMFEDSIRSAMGYGYPVEAVAHAAEITTDDVLAIVGDAAA